MAGAGTRPGEHLRRRRLSRSREQPRAPARQRRTVVHGDQRLARLVLHPHVRHVARRVSGGAVHRAHQRGELLELRSSGLLVLALRRHARRGVEALGFRDDAFANALAHAGNAHALAHALRACALVAAAGQGMFASSGAFQNSRCGRARGIVAELGAQGRFMPSSLPAFMKHARAREQVVRHMQAESAGSHLGHLGIFGRLLGPVLVPQNPRHDWWRPPCCEAGQPGRATPENQPSKERHRATSICLVRNGVASS